MRLRRPQALDRESLSALAKLAVFMVFTGACTFLLVLILGNGSFADRTEYKAVFTDVTGVAKGDDVRIAGVQVGAVSSVEIHDRSQAIVTFKVDSDTPLTQNTIATLKFRNLVGQRYLALSQGPDGSQARLKAGATLGLDQTQEALDLNVLLNGFKPVFQALSPDDLNTFAFEIVQTLQGEAGSVEDLLARTSSLTGTLADRDQLIGDTIVNLSQVLDTIGSRDEELTDTIDTLQQFVTGLKDDRSAILDSIDSVSALSNETSDLLVQGRPALVEDIKQLNALSGGLAKKKNLKLMSDAIQIFPFKMQKYGNAASSGSEFNFFLCQLTGRVVLPAIPQLGIDQTAIELPAIPAASNAEGVGARCNQ